MGQAAASPQPQASFKTGEAAKEVRLPSYFLDLNCLLQALPGYDVNGSRAFFLTTSVVDVRPGHTQRGSPPMDMLGAQHHTLQVDRVT